MKKIWLILVLSSLALFLAACSQSDISSDPAMYDKENYIGAADIESYMTDEYGIVREEMSAFKIEGDKAYMNGYISADTIRQIKKLLKDYSEVKTIVMQDVSGSLDDVSNLEASRLVREAGLNTIVPVDGHVASGGTDFFCAGVVRTADEGAKVGVHSWAGDGVENAALLAKDHKDHKKYIDYYSEMSMPDPSGFYFFTINAAKADGMHYMSQEELLKYGLVSSK